MPRVFLCNCARFNLSNIARRISQIICAATKQSLGKEEESHERYTHTHEGHSSEVLAVLL